MRADPSIQFGPLPVELPNQAPLPQASMIPGPLPSLPPGAPLPQPTLPPGSSIPAPQAPKTLPGPSHLGEWLRSIFEPIGKALGLAWPVMQWVLIGIGVALVLYALYRLIAPWLERRSAAQVEAAAGTSSWTPQRAEAEALLDDADALAAAGKFGEATHLLLMRSVEQIRAARPDWVLPASTTREISALQGLPDTARTAFASIAQRVERSLFALRRLDQADWQAARAAYADFALSRLDGPTR